MISLKGFQVLFVFANGNAILSSKNKLFQYNPDKNKFKLIIKFKYQSLLQNIILSSYFVRLLRGEIHHAIALPDDSILVFFDKRIIKVKNGNIITEFDIKTCKRPINVSFNKQNNLIAWGDYTTGENSQPINIYISDDYGESWRVSYKFRSGLIRHIHNIQYDNYRNCYWILTGDKDNESGLWWSEDLHTVEPFLTGSQKYRSVSIIPMENGLLIPMDTECETNFINYYSFQKEEIINIHKLNGSAFYAKKLQKYYFVSTIYEPSNINKHPYAELWNSRNGFDWQLILSIKKDILPVRYFQYPLIRIPIYENNKDFRFLYFSTKSVKNGNQTIIYSQNELKKTLK